MLDFFEYSGRPLAEMEAEIDAVRNAAAVDTELVRLEAGGAKLDIRRQGGFLTRLVLEDVLGEPIQVLYADPDLTVPRHVSSHVMLPVGPSSWPGGQHGPVRWLWHDLVETEIGSKGISATLTPRMAAGMPFVVRHALLTRCEVRLVTGIRNITGANLALSTGEHLYFDMPQGSASNVLINGQEIDELLGDGASGNIDEGRAQFWPGFGGVAEVTMPHGPELLIRSRLAGQGGIGVSVAGSIGMLVWRRPGMPFICLEPTLGYGIDGSNNNLQLPPKSTAFQETTISVT